MTKIRAFFSSIAYRVRYAGHLHSKGGLTWREAIAYPLPDVAGDPIEDAEAEIYYASFG